MRNRRLGINNIEPAAIDKKKQMHNIKIQLAPIENGQRSYQKERKSKTQYMENSEKIISQKENSMRKRKFTRLNEGQMYNKNNETQEVYDAKSIGIVELKSLQRQGLININNEKILIMKKSMINLLSKYLIEIKKLSHQRSSLLQELQEKEKYFIQIQVLIRQYLSHKENHFSLQPYFLSNKDKKEFSDGIQKMIAKMNEIFSEFIESEYSMKKKQEEKEMKIKLISEKKESLENEIEKVNIQIQKQKGRIFTLSHQNLQLQKQVQRWQSIWRKNCFYISNNKELSKKYFDKKLPFCQEFYQSLNELSHLSTAKFDNLRESFKNIQLSFNEFIFDQKKSIAYLSSKLNEFYQKITTLDFEKDNLKKKHSTIEKHLTNIHSIQQMTQKIIQKKKQINFLIYLDKLEDLINENKILLDKVIKAMGN